jgi:hypothetical protein
MCPYYDKLDVLFGERQNVDPADVREPILSDFEDDPEEEEEQTQVPDVVTPSRPRPRTGTGSSSEVSSASKKRDFSAAYLDSKGTEMEFKKSCFETEMEFKKEELRAQLQLGDKQLKKDTIISLIQSGKTAAEIKTFIETLGM